MSDTVQIALITIVGGGMLSMLAAWIKSVSDRSSTLAKEGKDQRDELREDIDALRAEIRELRTENASLREQRDVYHRRVQELESKVRTQEREISALHADLRALQRGAGERTRKDDEEMADG